MNNTLIHDHFSNVKTISYDKSWIINEQEIVPVLIDDYLETVMDNKSWSTQIEEIHEESTQNCWIDIYQREKVIDTLSHNLEIGNKTIVEFGASSGYMICDLKKSYPCNRYYATDLMIEGLLQSYKINPDIMHIQCDFTNAPFKDNSVDLIYSLNVLEHIQDDRKAIFECYRCLKHGGLCLYVVPRGANLYDYYDEMLFHKRRYARGELKSKCQDVGFEIIYNFHFAWMCYPAFWIKKKWNRHIGRRLDDEEKINRTKADIDNATSSTFEVLMMKAEKSLSQILRPPYGIREFVLCVKK